MHQKGYQLLLSVEEGNDEASMRLLFTLLINCFVSFSLVYGLGSMIGCCEVEVRMSPDHALSRAPCNYAFFPCPTSSAMIF